jgi:uncharacterized protein YfiM (DUF2279 family)
MKPILSIFIFIFNELKAAGCHLSKKSNYSKNRKGDLGFSSFSTFSIGVGVGIRQGKFAADCVHGSSWALLTEGNSHRVCPLVDDFLNEVTK